MQKAKSPNNMTTTKPQVSMPLSELRNPETKPSASTASASNTPNATPAPPKPAVRMEEPIKPKKPMKEPSTFKAAPINPAWADEVATSFGLTGQLAKDVASKLAAEITASITQKFNRPKLAKLVRTTVTKSIR